MPSSYSKFTIQDLNDLGIEVIEKPLFVSLNIPEKAPSDFLTATLERNQRRKLRSEKAKSEFIIAPILADLEEQNRGRFAFFSGYKFNVDAKKGLRGYCDYIFSAKPDAVVIEAPVFCAKLIPYNKKVQLSNIISTSLYLMSISLAFVSVYLSFIIFVGIPIWYFLPEKFHK